MRKELNGEGNLNKTFRGDSIKHCEVRKTSAGGSIQLIVSVDGKIVFESAEVESEELIAFDAAGQ